MIKNIPELWGGERILLSIQQPDKGQSSITDLDLICHCHMNREDPSYTNLQDRVSINFQTQVHNSYLHFPINEWGHSDLVRIWVVVGIGRWTWLGHMIETEVSGAVVYADYSFVIGVVEEKETGRG